jgi:acyl-homoserine lactone acylase PvdQ
MDRSRSGRQRRAPAHLIALACACLLMTIPAHASAGVLRASSSLPPGESGFVSVAGVAAGTGSPHLYDQQQPFIAFQRKNAMLGQPGSSQTPRPGVTISRDAFGVPSVTGTTSDELWWGAGYATAQDRLAELEIFRRATTGHLAEVLGASYLPMDIEVRRDYYTNAELDRMIAALPASLQARYAAYRDGINAWVDHVLLTPTDMPGEFPALGLLPTHFSVQDLAAIGVYLARTTPNTDGDDLNDMHALQASGPAKFNRILPLRIAGQLSTIARADGMFPSVPGRTRAQERAALARSAAFVRNLPLPPAGNLGTELISGTMPSSAKDAAATRTRLVAPIHRGGSSMVAIGNTRTHHAFLFSGPELGFSAPEELYEIELHGPGVDVRGVTAPGAPVVAIGHNKHVAFGLTSGLSQTNALYTERLVPGHPDEYYFRGRIRQMDCRAETFGYRTPVTGLTSSRPQIGSVTQRVCRTVHGPVQERVGNVAYARRYATWLRETDTIRGLADVDAARTVFDVNHAIGEVTWNENMMAADDRGNIGYWHPGLLPIRPAAWDERLPYPGSGQAEWRGFLPVVQRPHVINPAQGWLANWNNILSQGWTTGNDPASERLGGPFYRVAWLDRLASAVAKHPTFDGMNQMIHQEGTVAQQRPLVGAKLRRALHGAGGGAAAVLRAILAWDGSYNEADSHGTVAPGVAAWQELKDQLQKLALGPLGAAGQLIGGGGPMTSTPSTSTSAKHTPCGRWVRALGGMRRRRRSPRSRRGFAPPIRAAGATHGRCSPGRHWAPRNLRRCRSSIAARSSRSSSSEPDLGILRSADACAAADSADAGGRSGAGSGGRHPTAARGPGAGPSRRPAGDQGSHPRAHCGRCRRGVERPVAADQLAEPRNAAPRVQRGLRLASRSDHAAAADGQWTQARAGGC